MSRPESLRKRLAVALACASFALSGAAHAGMGALWDDLVCENPATVPNGFAFETLFLGRPDCARQCRDVRTICLRYVLDAASCQSTFAKDFIGFDASVDCAGLTGSRLADCKAGWALDLQIWLEFIRGDSLNGRFRCEGLAATCQRRCAGIDP